MTTENKTSFEDGIKIAEENPHWTCRFHPTDWFHEIGCPHQQWTVKQLQDALETKKAVIRVLQYDLYGTALDGNPIVISNESKG